MFNVIISGEPSVWETDQLMRMDVTRFKEYSGGPDADKVSIAKPATWKLLEKAPTLLLYDVSVGLGSCCGKVTGLLANAIDNVNQIAARDGTVLTRPFNFEELYHHFADSWRVSPKESLLTACGDRDYKSGIPRRPFYARDLDPKVYKRARAIAIRAGLKEGPLLDAATLDIAVIGDKRAAQVFRGAYAPIAVGEIK
jgi:hypothetical protein